MVTMPELAAEALGSHLAEHMGRRFGSTDARFNRTRRFGCQTRYRLYRQQ